MSDEIKVEKLWCAWCGKYGDHQSGGCFDAKQSHVDVLKDQLEAERAKVKELTEFILQSVDCFCESDFTCHKHILLQKIDAMKSNPTKS